MSQSYTDKETLTDYEVPCPYRDGFKGRGTSISKATAQVLDHLADAHWTELPGDAKDAIHACAHTVSTIPV